MYYHGILLNTITKQEVSNFANRSEVINTFSEHMLEALQSSMPLNEYVDLLRLGVGANTNPINLYNSPNSTIKFGFANRY